MRRLVLLLLCGLLCPSLVLAVTEHEGKFTKHYANSLFKVTEHGLFSVEMLIIGNELKVGPNAMDIIVHDKNDHDVMGAEVTVTPWMPAMGHGTMEKPVVTERGGGLYGVENVVTKHGRPVGTQGKGEERRRRRHRRFSLSGRGCRRHECTSTCRCT